MTEPLLIDALGGVVAVDASSLDSDDARAVRAAWTDAAGTGPPSATVVADGSEERGRLLADLSQRVTLAAIEAARGRAWMLHAAGVALEDGRVLAFVGPSGRGKTTAALALGAVYGYVSDETVAIDESGAVLPYRKPLSVIEDSAAPKVQRAPSEAGLRTLPEAELRLAGVVLLDRRPDAPLEPVVEAVDLGDALADLVAQTSYLPDLDRPLQTLARHVAAAGGVQRVTYREAASLVALVPALASAAPVAPPTAAVPAERADSSVTVAPSTEPVRYSRTPVVDALELEDPDRVALLQVDESGTGTVRVLAGIAPGVWRAAHGATLDQLVAAAVAAYGAPDGAPDGADATSLVAAAVETLVEEGALHAAVAEMAPGWRIRDDVAWTDSGDRVVALALSDPTASPLALEGSGSAIWRALAQSPDTTVDALVTGLAGDFGVEPAAIHAEVDDFLRRLEGDGLAGVADPRTS